ncbi:hypothetical protein NPX13_g7990 [Xylaria arbuscula]|uniref:Uncharacterized protein n=1 Tax=Xylaria arbuscula TaxID=114810 RepID=A0A9W8N9F9_9PEZI|nr:hypothetical protein NPX13_g7990 [Xylaria arbuscula]
MCRVLPVKQTLPIFNGAPTDKDDPNSPDYIRASDARAQQRALNKRRRPYPSRFENIEELPLQINPPLVHKPLTPGTTDPWSPSSGRPGAVRSVYNPDNPEQFEVIFHDERAGKTDGGTDRYTKANYHPSASSGKNDKHKIGSTGNDTGKTEKNDDKC